MTQLYSSLNYLNVEAYQPEQMHQILKITGNPVRESTRLATKLKLVTDTYILQTKRVRFSNTEQGAQCLLCEEADATVQHFILKCRVLESIRQNSIKTICVKHYGDSYSTLRDCERLQILDSSKGHELFYKGINSDHLSETESRRLCYMLHGAR